MANIERLQQLRRVVEAAPDHRFHMRRFFEESSCGTAYCAAGWAAVDPWFREHTPIGDIFEVDPDGWLYEVDDRRTYLRLAALFAMTPTDAGRLFGGDLCKYDDPHAVAKGEVLANIDRLIAGQPAARYAAVSAPANRDESC